MRGVILGPALFLLSAPPASVAEEPAVSDTPYYVLVRRLLRDESYILIEPAGGAGAPRILFLEHGNGPALTSLSHAEQALLSLGHPDADIREEAVLTLADSEDKSLRSYLFLALGDADEGVRDAAEAVLDDE